MNQSSISQSIFNPSYLQSLQVPLPNHPPSILHQSLPSIYLVYLIYLLYPFFTIYPFFAFFSKIYLLFTLLLFSIFLFISFYFLFFSKLILFYYLSYSIPRQSNSMLSTKHTPAIQLHAVHQTHPGISMPCCPPNTPRQFNAMLSIQHPRSHTPGHTPPKLSVQFQPFIFSQPFIFWIIPFYYLSPNTPWSSTIMQSVLSIKHTPATHPRSHTQPKFVKSNSNPSSFNN